MPSTLSEHANNPVFCAIDTQDLGHAQALARSLAGHVGGIKLGLEFFSTFGPEGIRQMSEAGTPVFLDLKLHDIPNTVAKAVQALAPLAPAIMTIHTQGGPDMMVAAAKAARDSADELGITPPKLVGVTVLTSLDDSDLARMGVGDGADKQVVRLAALAQESGLDGIVCSPMEVAQVRAALGDDFFLVVPGIRPAGSDKGDQKRVMTPAEAVAAGANVLVIGRPITGADDPAFAAQEITASIDG